MSITSSFAKKMPVDFDDELKIGDVWYDHMTKLTIKVQLFWRLPYENVTMLKYEPFMSNRRLKKVLFPGKSVFIFLLAELPVPWTVQVWE